MSEWWTYRLSDFLMFSPAVYWRLIERYNREVWPLHLLAIAGGLVLLWRVGTHRPRSDRAVAWFLAAAWLWVGLAFYVQRYASINWAARFMALAWAVEAALLVWAAVSRPRLQPAAVSRARPVLGWALAILALVYPLAGFMAGRPWTQAEVLGLMPEPTALATLGLLCITPLPHRTWLVVIPALSLAVGVMTLRMMSA